MAFKVKPKLFARNRPVISQPFARKLVRVSNEAIKIVLNEVRVLSSLQEGGGHPNIVNILKHGWLGDVGGIYFIDMELADLTLSQYISYTFDRESFPIEITPTHLFKTALAHRDCSDIERLRNIWTIGIHIASGLEFMHAQGHVHRDLKPPNGTVYHIS